MDELRKIDLNLLLTLHALLIERHVTRAALRLHRSQPAVSHALAQLRTHFNDPLLIRRDGHMVLSVRAQGLVKPLDEALGSLNGLLAAADFDPAQARRQFRLSLSDYASRLILPPLIRHLRNVAPGIHLAISQASRDVMLAQLLDGELDLALGIFPPSSDEVVVQDLFEERFVSIADKSVLPARGGLALDDWLARPHAMLTMRPDAQDEVERALIAKGLQRDVVLVMPHWSAAVEILPGTDLILTVARRAIGSLKPHKVLREFKPPLALAPFAYQQAWHIRKDNDSGHRWLREAIFACSQPVT